MALFKVNTPSLFLVQELPAGRWAQDPGGSVSTALGTGCSGTGVEEGPFPLPCRKLLEKSVSNMRPQGLSMRTRTNGPDALPVSAHSAHGST